MMGKNAYLKVAQYTITNILHGRVNDNDTSSGSDIPC